MSDLLSLDSVLRSVRPLIDAGAALHWLAPRDKMPIEGAWSSKPRYTLEQLKEKYHKGYNIGVRPGEPSKIGNLYLHVLDVDIRKAELAHEAWSAVTALIGDYKRLPSVISGSGGESRHLYFLCAQPLRGKHLTHSDGFEMVWDKKKERDVKKRDWEIDIKGTGSNLVLPPSIHPSGLPYCWERDLDLDFPFLYEIPESTVASWGVQTTDSSLDDEDDLFTLTRQEPLDIDEDEVDRILRDLPEDWVEDRDFWYRTGMALHHQYRGDSEGFEKWCEWSKQSKKFDLKDSKRVWKSFGSDKNPVRMATLISAANNNRLSEALDLDDDDFEQKSTDLGDLLGDSEPKTIKDLTRPDPNWTQRLHRNEEGELKTTLPNIALIVENDPRTRGIAAFNEFKQELVLKNPPKKVKKKRDSSPDPVNLEGRLWVIHDQLNGDNWTDSHDTAIRNMIESKTNLQGYGIKLSDRDLRGAIDISAQSLSFHPVKQLLESVTWDGVPRCETLFIDYLGTKDNAYYRQAALLTLIGAVARVFRPGCKFDFVPILEGVQGKGKSTFVQVLGLEWYAELQGNVDDVKQMVESMQGSWILEIGELSTLHRSELNAMKAFVSRKVDKARLAWEKRARDFPRQCIFIGSTNDREYLRDQTGGRRFWPIVCEVVDQIDNPRLQKNVMQIWAEALHIYKEMAAKYSFDLPLYMTDEAAQLALEMQESRRVESVEEILAGDILKWLDTPIGDEFDDLEPDTPKQLRQETCTLQIWREMMGREGTPSHLEAIKIGKAMQIVGWDRTHNVMRTLDINKKYGTCRVYLRK